jgi:hypothetical protein
MRIYHFLYNRIYALFNKGASINPTNEKFDGAILSSIIFSCLLYINILTIMLILNLFLKININIGMFYSLTIMISLMIVNLVYFLRNKKYNEISQVMIRYSKKKVKFYTTLTWIYSLMSVGLFFFLLNCKIK